MQFACCSKTQIECYTPGCIEKQVKNVREDSPEENQPRRSLLKICRQNNKFMSIVYEKLKPYRAAQIPETSAKYEEKKTCSGFKSDGSINNSLRYLVECYVTYTQPV